MANMFKLEFKLKQHTPLIHFQHDQAGATLRASEVKPKLDRFILEKLGGFDTVWDSHKKWFVGVGEKTKKEDVQHALNYKLRFFGENIKIHDVPKYSIYYGNMGENSNKALFWTGDCRGEIICFVSDLLTKIKEYLNEFFICTNFGRMQNKGFGSFTVEGGKTDDAAAVLKKYCGAKACYSFQVKKIDDDPVREDAFDKIKTLYSVMKSGYNINGKYHRSFLFEYFQTLNIGNEKAFMKKEGVSPQENGEPVWISHKYDPKKEKAEEKNLYVRAVLGVGEKIDYIASKDKIKNKKDKMVYPRTPVLISSNESEKKEKIERFASPIFFKIIDGKVYYTAKRVDKVIFGKSFLFQSRKTDSKGRVDKYATGKSVVLKTPEEFDVDAFLKYFFENYDPYAEGYGIQVKISEEKGDKS